MFTQLIDSIYSAVSSIPFDALVWSVFGSFAAIFLIVLFCTVMLKPVKFASKMPYLCLVNIYTALTLAVFLTKNAFAHSVLAAVLFWCVGFLSYGVVCFFSKKKKKKTVMQDMVLTSVPAVPVPAARRVDAPAAKSSVRLEHAMSVTDRLLAKNLGKGDRQELEKLKNTLAVLQLKGTLSPAESDILNDNFNALLKLMAKYNV